MDWFKINSLKANPGKFQFMVLGANKNDCFNLNVAGKVIPSSSEVKLLGITIDYELKLKKNILMNSVGKHIVSSTLYREHRDIHKLTKQYYLLMHLLSVDLIMDL